MYIPPYAFLVPPRSRSANGAIRWPDTRPTFRNRLRPLARPAAADPAARERHDYDVPDAAEPQHLVHLRRHPHLHAGGADRHRHRAGDALCAELDLAFNSRRTASCATSTTAGCCATCIRTARRCSSSPSTSTSSAASITARTRRRAKCCGSSACIIYLLMIATAFFGYVLPWGQMSFWARHRHHQPVHLDRPVLPHRGHRDRDAGCGAASPSAMRR